MFGVWGQVGMGWVTGFQGREWRPRTAEEEPVRSTGPFLGTQETKVYGGREGGRHALWDNPFSASPAVPYRSITKAALLEALWAMPPCM